MRVGALIALIGALSSLGACGRSSDAAHLRSYVGQAIAHLPYQYRLLSKPGSSQYIVFKVINPRKNLGVDVAFALPLENHSCAALPTLPAKYRKGFRPFSGAEAEPLICFAADDQRAPDGREASIIRGTMAKRVVVSLCEQVYGGFESFACFDRWLFSGRGQCSLGWYGRRRVGRRPKDQISVRLAAGPVRTSHVEPAS